MAKKKINTNIQMPQYDDFFEAPSILPGQNNSLGSAMAPKFQGYNTGINQSKYDSNFNWNAQTDYDDIHGSINEHRAQTQPWYDKAGAGLARVGAKILTETAKLPGYVGGAIAAPFAPDGEGFETAFNNQWIKSINENAEAFNNEYLPVYVKKAVKEGNLWDNISSIDFWATEGADGIGFIASMLVPGAIFKSLGLGSKAMGATTKAMAFAKGEQSVANSVRTLSKLGINANKFDIAGTAMVNTYIESAAEAGGAMQGMDDQKDIIIDGYLKQGLSLEAAEKQFTDQKARLGRDIFVSNVGILAIPNLIQSKMIWGKAVNKLAKVDNPSLLTKAGNRGKNILGATASEGFLEEAGQSTVEHMFGEKAKRGELKEGFFGTSKDFNIGELGEAYLDTISSTDGQKAMFLGAFLGGGMSTYQGAKQDISDRKESSSIRDWVKGNDFNFNDILEEDTYLRDKQGNIQYHPNNEPIQDKVKVIKKLKALQATEDLNNEYEEAVNNGDYKTAESIQKKAENQFILPFVRRGEAGIQALRENLEQTIKSEDIQSSNQNRQAENKVRDLISRAEVMQKKYQTYQDFSRDLVVLENENATDEQKIAFYNKLADDYVNEEGNRYEAKKTLEKLNKQKSELLSELGDNPNIKTNEIIDENTQDDAFKYRFEEDPRVVKINNEIEEASKEIDRIDNKINKDLWNKEEVNKAFNEHVNQYKKLSAIMEVVENEEQYNEVLDTIDSITEKEELLKYVQSLPKNISSNMVVFEKMQDKLKDINNTELQKQQIVEELKKQEDAQKFQEDTDFGTTSTPTTTTKAGETTTVAGLGTVQSSNVAEVNKDDEIEDLSASTLQLLNKNNPITKDKNQGAARVVSTNQETGKPLKGLEDFVKYEKEPRDKTKDKVSFELGDIDPKNLSFTSNEIFKRLKKGEALTEDEIKLLEEQLPIKVKFKNGNTEAYSFIDSMNHPNPEIVARETLPLRKAIVKALIDNKGSFEGIEGKIDKQFTGTLKIGEQGSNILELDVFKGMTESEKINYFKKNTVYVSNKGETKYTYQDKLDDSSPLGATHRGEVFLKIPMLNGKDFYLKLNTSRLSYDKAKATFELIKLHSNIITDSKSENESVSNQAKNFGYIQIKELIENDERFSILKPELELLEKTGDEVDISVERLINVLVYSQNTNAKTKLTIDENGVLTLGELLTKVNQDIPSDIGTYVYGTDTLNGLTDIQQEAIVNYLMYKRHNVLITKDDTLAFNNDEYIKYLLNPKYSILSTNAVVNEPTFQGYSNIYLNQAVTNSNKVQPKEVPSEKVEEMDSQALLDSLNGNYGSAPIENKTEVKKENIQTIEYKNNKYIVNTEKGTILNEKTNKTISGTSIIGKKVLDLVNWDDLENEQQSVVNNVVETKTNSKLSYAEIFNKSTNQEQMLEEAITKSGMLIENLTDFGVNDFVKMMEMLEKLKKTNEINKICGK